MHHRVTQRDPLGASLGPVAAKNSQDRGIPSGFRTAHERRPSTGSLQCWSGFSTLKQSVFALEYHCSVGNHEVLHCHIGF
jgi:hypothetical protein